MKTEPAVRTFPVDWNAEFKPPNWKTSLVFHPDAFKMCPLPTSTRKIVIKIDPNAHLRAVAE